MKVVEIIECSVSNWYYKFKKVTIPCVLIELNEEFIAYLNQDKIILPKGWNYENEDDTIEHKNILENINGAIRKFNGKVFPKLNWSAPRDASYMICNGATLQCTHASDIICLLKGSEFITHDLTAPYHYCTDAADDLSEKPKFYLALKRFENFQPAFEFRCFVKNNKLIAISQRHIDLYCKDVHRDLENLCYKIRIFYQSEIAKKFPLSDYVFDVYALDEVVLIDFNPFSSDITDSALFTWQQLLDIDTKSNALPLVACIEHESAVQRSSLEQYALPIEVETVLRGQSDNLFEYLQKAMLDQSDSSDQESDQEEN